jgi:hypothetical protein
MSFYRRYSIVIGGLVLFLVVVVLVSVPSDILAMQATFIGTDLQRATENETSVRTKMDLGDAEHLKEFPKQFGDWLGIDRGSSDMAENLGADVLLLRTYINLGYYQPIDFAVVQGSEPTSFHPPPICYRAAGWEIEEEGVATIPVPDVRWAGTSEPVSITAKKLVAVRRPDGEKEEREVALYFYVKGRLFEDTVTMVQVFAEVLEGVSCDKILQELTGFMGEVVPYMFEPEEQEGEMLAVNLARSWGGRAILVVLAVVPVAIMVYPRVRRD